MGSPTFFSYTKQTKKIGFFFFFCVINTAVLYEVQKVRFGLPKGAARGTKTQKIKMHPLAVEGKALPEKFLWDLSASFQSSVVRWLVEKTFDAAEFKEVDQIAVGGGVSANGFLVESLVRAAQDRGMRVFSPERGLALDNAAMIARRGIEMFRSKCKPASLKLAAVPNLTMG